MTDGACGCRWEEGVLVCCGEADALFSACLKWGYVEAEWPLSHGDELPMARRAYEAHLVGVVQGRPRMGRGRDTVD